MASCDSKRGNIHEEQISHKVIEKRRRDRINNCLTELSQTVPAAFAKQHSGKLEKAEILEMTVEYLRAIQSTEIGIRYDNGEWFSVDIWSDFVHNFQAGYKECMHEVYKYMTDIEGCEARDTRCLRMVSYLETRFRPETATGDVAWQRNAGRSESGGQNAYFSQYSKPHNSENAALHSHLRGTRRFSPYMTPPETPRRISLPSSSQIVKLESISSNFPTNGRCISRFLPAFSASLPNSDTLIKTSVAPSLLDLTENRNNKQQ